jgi:rare lipoprotein A
MLCPTQDQQGGQKPKRISAMKTLTLMALTVGAGLLFLPVLADVSHADSTEQCGKASWYALTSKTASGEYANPAKMTAAHRSLKFGTKVRVKNMENGKAVTLRINDRGPFIKGRIIDVTKAAEGKLGFINAGTTKVCLQIME